MLLAQTKPTNGSDMTIHQNVEWPKLKFIFVEHQLEDLYRAVIETRDSDEEWNRFCTFLCHRDVLAGV